ncbi:MAG: AAA family ATPase [Pseudomonadota bacterium]
MKAGAPAPLSAGEAAALFQRIGANIEHVMRGSHATVRKLLAAFASGGHVLIEDYPGTGKTTLAKSLAASIGARFARVQFTPDLLPSDILGVSVFNQKEQTFEFRAGPVFTSILLADEINRASPRTQSALLEVMAEAQVSVEGRTYPMDELFFVIATQNPVEFRGTYPLPEAQMDRFAMCLALGYVDAETEMEVLAAQDLGHPLARLRPVASREEVLALKDRVRQVRCAEEVRRYIVELVRRTRTAPQVQLGCGPRASLALAHAAKALALLEASEYVRPEHVQELAVPVLAHRIVLDTQARFAGATGAALVADILREVPVPA